jgi:hypothetical protein
MFVLKESDWRRTCECFEGETAVSGSRGAPSCLMRRNFPDPGRCNLGPRVTALVRRYCRTDRGPVGACQESAGSPARTANLCTLRPSRAHIWPFTHPTVAAALTRACVVIPEEQNSPGQQPSRNARCSKRNHPSPKPQTACLPAFLTPRPCHQCSAR